MRSIFKGYGFKLKCNSTYYVVYLWHAEHIVISFCQINFIFNTPTSIMGLLDSISVTFVSSSGLLSQQCFPSCARRIERDCPSNWVCIFKQRQCLARWTCKFFSQLGSAAQKVLRKNFPWDSYLQAATETHQAQKIFWVDSSGFKGSSKELSVTMGLCLHAATNPVQLNHQDSLSQAQRLKRHFKGIVWNFNYFYSIVVCCNTMTFNTISINIFIIEINSIYGFNILF